jgi:hypothetical protein
MLTKHTKYSVEARRVVKFSVDCIAAHAFDEEKFDDKAKFRFFYRSD